jgi:hypothetical protein
MMLPEPTILIVVVTVAGTSVPRVVWYSRKSAPLTVSRLLA